LESSSLLSNWAIALAAVLAILIGLIAGFGAVGYFVAARRIKQPFLRFLIRYALIFLLLLDLEIGVAYFLPSVHNTLRDATASFVGWILGLVGVGHSVAGPEITVNDPDLTFDVTMACLGGVLFWVYSGLVLAILVAFNLFRITISIYLEWRTGVNVHNYFYLFNMLFVLLVWAVWVRTLKPGAATLGTPAVH
jgi:hypothetical protein